MTKKAAWILLVAVLALMVAPVTFAQAAAAPEHTTNWVGVAAAFALGIAAAGCGIGQGLATAAACEGTARNPGAGGAVRTAFIIGVALIESLTLYALVIVLIK
ncbi:MAG TPA: ATP synthase F0 subunit C [Candidatus Cybelea sp.]|jgi:F-type H+-transporting ATPase subunit c|nr:ATP synthase F0 subunit C [Candidatus Cybelea sp.]